MEIKLRFIHKHIGSKKREKLCAFIKLVENALVVYVAPSSIKDEEIQIFRYISNLIGVKKIFDFDNCVKFFFKQKTSNLIPRLEEVAYDPYVVSFPLLFKPLITEYHKEISKEDISHEEVFTILGKIVSYLVNNHLAFI